MTHTKGSRSLPYLVIHSFMVMLLPHAQVLTST
jgi:hypothetical protein